MRFEATIGIDAIKLIQFSKVKDIYGIICDGRDPITKKQIYVDCVVGETTYRMNAGKDAAEKMDAGVRIFERQGSPVMPIIRDFHNVNHTNLPMADAIAISVLQGADALGHWMQYGQKVDAINSAQTVQEVRDVPLGFVVNVEE